MSSISEIVLWIFNRQYKLMWNMVFICEQSWEQNIINILI